jgi:MFS family permease
VDSLDGRGERWRVAAAAAVGVFCASQPFTTFSVFLKPVAETFSWSRQTTASAYSAMALITAISAPVLGAVLDRLGARRVIAPCLLLSGAAVMSLALLTNRLWHLYAAFSVIGVVTIGASPVAQSRVIFSWFEQQRGRALALMLAGAGLSGILLPPFAQWLIREAGWRVAWVALGAITLTCGVPVVVRFVREGPATLPAAGRVEVLRDALASRVFWTLVVVVFASTIALFGAAVHLTALLTDRGVVAERAAIVASALAAGNLVGRLLTGWLIDRFTATRVACALLTLTAAGTLLLAQAHTFVSGLLAALSMGIGAGGEFDIAPYLLGRHFGLRSISTLYGFIWMATMMAGALGPVWLGSAYDATGSYTWLLAKLAAVTFGAGLLMLTLPPVDTRVPAPPAPVV